MRFPTCLGFVLFLVIPMSIGCNKGSDTPKAPSDGAKEKLYDIKGKVVALDAAKKTVTVDHEDIPGLMKAMEMKFAVEDAKALETLKPGDQVQGRLRVKSGEYTITELKTR